MQALSLTVVRGAGICKFHSRITSGIFGTAASRLLRLVKDALVAA